MTVSPSLYFPRSRFHKDAWHRSDLNPIRRPIGSAIDKNVADVLPNQLVLKLSSVTVLFVLDVKYDTTNLRPTFDDRICGKKMIVSTPNAATPANTRGNFRRCVGRSVRTTGLGKFISSSMDASVYRRDRGRHLPFIGRFSP